MRVLVTGGGGYVGTVLVRALIDARHTVSVLDRFDWGTQPLLSAVGRSRKLVTVYAGDLLDPRILLPALAPADAVIHLAGIVGYPACDADQQEADRTNVEGTALLCQHLEGKPLLFASTGSTYGRVEGLALESHPISPLTRYGRNKAQAEGFVRDVGGVSLRLATLFGLSCRMRWDLLPHSFAREAVRSGALKLYEGGAHRTFLHVQDAALCFVEALGGGLTRGDVYNVGRAAGNHTKLEVASIVQQLTDCTVTEAEGRDPDQRDYTVGFGKIREALPRWGVTTTGGLGELALRGALGEVVKWARVWREGR